MQICFNAKKSNVKRNLPCMITHWLEWGDWLQFCHFILFYMALEMQETLRFCHFDDINRPPFYTMLNLTENWLVFKVCIIRLVHIVWKNLRRLFGQYTVARTEHDALVKSTTKIFSNFVAFSENPNFEGWTF